MSKHLTVDAPDGDQALRRRNYSRVGTIVAAVLPRFLVLSEQDLRACDEHHAEKAEH